MVGRGTRLCPDLFGPGQDKDSFRIFDYCQNLEYFGQNPATVDGALPTTLATRLFNARLELIGELDRCPRPEESDMAREPRSPAYAPKSDWEVRRSVADALHRETAAMNVDNFLVRPKRRSVERYGNREAWNALSSHDLSTLSRDLAGLPAAIEPEKEEAKRFDLLVLNLQLAMLRSESSFARLRDQVKALAALLEEKATIPMVRDQTALIQDVQNDEWWQDVTIPMLEALRRRLRDLIALIDKQKRKPMYTDFEDEIGSETSIELSGVSVGINAAKFRNKARVFLRAHQDHVAIHKLRTNRPLTSTDLSELERMLVDSGVGGLDDVRAAASEAHGLGLFVRALVGMDRGAAKDALSVFLTGKTMTASQIEFIDLIVNRLTEHGLIEPRALYASPFTDLSPRGPDVLFQSAELDVLISVLEDVRQRASAS
ncbi:MAG: type I restriction-modification enzyme R subunit C-terminal domain-containing protein [Burkholderiaceae bacterium]